MLLLCCLSSDQHLMAMRFIFIMQVYRLVLLDIVWPSNTFSDSDPWAKSLVGPNGDRACVRPSGYHTLSSTHIAIHCHAFLTHFELLPEWVCVITASEVSNFTLLCAGKCNMLHLGSGHLHCHWSYLPRYCPRRYPGGCVEFCALQIVSDKRDQANSRRSME